MTSPGPQGFQTTHWSVVLLAGSEAGSQAQAREALEELCRAYWYPLYAFARHRGYAAHEAQDLTQSFFAQVLEKRAFSSANPERGRFRSYLLGAMKHFLANEWHRGRTVKRGGRANIVELDALDPETRHALEPATAPDPDAGFDREWALESIHYALQRLRAESVAGGRGEQFDELKGSLTGAELERDEAARRLGMTTNAVKVAVHRLRQRFRELLRAEITKTVVDPQDVDDEMRHLVSALRSA